MSRAHEIDPGLRIAGQEKSDVTEHLRREEVPFSLTQFAYIEVGETQLVEVVPSEKHNTGKSFGPPILKAFLGLEMIFIGSRVGAEITKHEGRVTSGSIISVLVVMAGYGYAVLGGSRQQG